MDKTKKIFNKVEYSVIMPIFNEEANISKLHYEIVATMNKIGKSYEIITVDDGSCDNSLNILKKLNHIKIIEFRKNFGQTAALDAGIKECVGNYIITLDADGQNPPSEIPKLIKKIDEGYDVVSGWRYKRKDPITKKLTSRGADYLRKILIKDHIHDSGCTLKIYKSECFNDLDLYGEMHRFIPALLRWQGFEVAEVKVEHRERKHGKTKYNYKRIIKGFLDMWAVWFWRKYSSRPLHLFGGIGLIFGILGTGLLVLLGIGRLLGLFNLSDKVWPLIAVFLLLVGLQLFSSGILADILAKTYFTKEHKSYFIKNIFEDK